MKNEIELGCKNEMDLKSLSQMVKKEFYDKKTEITYSVLQRKFYIGYPKATELMDFLIDNKIVKIEDGKKYYVPLASKDIKFKIKNLDALKLDTKGITIVGGYIGIANIAMWHSLINNICKQKERVLCVKNNFSRTCEKFISQNSGIHLSDVNKGGIIKEQEFQLEKEQEKLKKYEFVEICNYSGFKKYVISAIDAYAELGFKYIFIGKFKLLDLSMLEPLLEEFYKYKDTDLHIFLNCNIENLAIKDYDKVNSLNANTILINQSAGMLGDDFDLTIFKNGETEIKAAVLNLNKDTFLVK